MLHDRVKLKNHSFRKKSSGWESLDLGTKKRFAASEHTLKYPEVDKPFVFISIEALGPKVFCDFPLAIALGSLCTINRK